LKSSIRFAGSNVEQQEPHGDNHSLNTSIEFNMDKSIRFLSLLLTTFMIEKDLSTIVLLIGKPKRVNAHLANSREGDALTASK
jgi:hypothetical protein